MLFFKLRPARPNGGAVNKIRLSHPRSKNAPGFLRLYGRQNLSPAGGVVYLNLAALAAPLTAGIAALNIADAALRSRSTPRRREHTTPQTQPPRRREHAALAEKWRTSPLKRRGAMPLKPPPPRRCLSCAAGRRTIAPNDVSHFRHFIFHLCRHKPYLPSPPLPFGKIMVYKGGVVISHGCRCVKKGC